MQIVQRMSHVTPSEDRLTCMAFDEEGTDTVPKLSVTLTTE